MTTRMAAARGYEWSDSILYDGWGEDATDEEIKDLGDCVVTLFEARARLAGVNAVWFPSLAEVHCDEGDPDVDLDAIRVAAFEEIWNNLVYGEEG